MTIPYNASHRSMKSYLGDALYIIRYEDGVSWYSTHSGDQLNIIDLAEINNKPIINDCDLSLLISSIKEIIDNDFLKIKKLTKYLRNIANIMNMLELSLTWSLPSGISITQSYL
jgi:hypothetical protein